MDQQICIDNCRKLSEISDEVARETSSNKMEHESFKRRIDELEENGKRQHEILITLQKQADAIESMNEKIDDVADSVKTVAGRLSEIEKEPGEKWKKIVFEVIK